MSAVTLDSKSNRSISVAFIGEAGFPIGLGSIQRLSLLAQGLIYHDCDVTIVSAKGIHGPRHNFAPAGVFEGIPYLYTSGTVQRPRNIFKRNYLKIVGKISELLFLRKLKRQGKLTACFVSTMRFDALVLYWFWLRLIRVPLILDYVEMNSAIVSRVGNWKWVNDYLFDRMAAKLSDGVTPISDFLVRHLKNLTLQKPYQKLPILCDFAKFDPINKTSGETIITYCGAASYYTVIEFVLEAFSLLDLAGLDEAVYLDLILGGSEDQLSAVKDAIAVNRNRGNIRIFSNISHDDIPTFYAQSSALLIPLRPTTQDAARFPHKLGEYLASGRPVITTNYGEVRNYGFSDGDTAMIADEFDPVSFSKKIEFVISHPECANSIGLRGREMARRNFDFRNVGLLLRNFISELQ